MSEIVKGFKVFNAEWVCRDKEYTCPGRFKEEGIELELCVLDSELRETQTANYFSSSYPADCTVSPANA